MIPPDIECLEKHPLAAPTLTSCHTHAGVPGGSECGHRIYLMSPLAYALGQAKFLILFFRRNWILNSFLEFLATRSMGGLRAPPGACLPRRDP